MLWLALRSARAERNMMTVKQLIEILEKCDGDKVAVCTNEHGGWDNIEQVREDDGVVSIEFGGGSPFSDE